MVDIIFHYPFLGAMGDHSKKKPGTAMCVGCGSQIHDQFILRVSPDLEWHAACLKCAECSQYLDETCTCFVRDGKTYCKRDYVSYKDSAFTPQDALGERHSGTPLQVGAPGRATAGRRWSRPRTPACSPAPPLPPPRAAEEPRPQSRRGRAGARAQPLGLRRAVHRPARGIVCAPPLRPGSGAGSPPEPWREGFPESGSRWLWGRRSPRPGARAGPAGSRPQPRSGPCGPTWGRRPGPAPAGAQRAQGRVRRGFRLYFFLILGTSSFSFDLQRKTHSSAACEAPKRSVVNIK
uniref:LIM zinc-binding domain-containing protein n=1 Tax=Felis catus TaxID=9685 RepID=A0ABI7Y2B8_FELCA